MSKPTVTADWFNVATRPEQRQQLLTVTLVLLIISANTLAQSLIELQDDGDSPGDIVTYGMSYSLQRFSPLEQINTQSVADLVPAWSFSLGDDRGQEAQPVLYEGKLFVTTHKNTFAVDARTGRQLWRHDVNYPQGSHS